MLDLNNENNSVKSRKRDSDMDYWCFILSSVLPIPFHKAKVARISFFLTCLLTLSSALSDL